MNEQYSSNNSQQQQNQPGYDQSAYEQQPFYDYQAPPYAQYPPYAQNPQPYYRKQKPKLQLEQRDRIFAGIAFILSLFGVVFGIWGKFYLGFSVSFLITFGVLTVYLGKGNRFPGLFAAVCGICSIALCSVFFMTTAKSVRLFSLLLLPCVSTVWFAGLTGRKATKKDLGILSFLADIFAGSFGTAPKGIVAIFSSSTKKSKHFSKILIGVLCALPVLFAVIPLLSSSDEAFSNLLKKMFSDIGRNILQIILSLIITPFLTGYAFYLRKEPPKATKISTFKGVDTMVLTTSLSVLSLCYLFYLFSQLAYFFSGFLGILPEGYDFSHAEYARRGFFELCAIAGINLAVLFAALLLSRKQNEKPPVSLRIPATFIILFNLLLIGTAISKLILYIRAYGMTVLRIGTSAFAVFMAFVFIAMLLRYYLPKVRVLSFALPIAACVLIILGIGNINRFVANYNYQLYLSNPQYEIDVDYFGELGAEGTEVLTRLAIDDNPEVAQKAQIALYYALQDQYKTESHEQPAAGEIPSYEYYTIEARLYKEFPQFCVPRWKMYKATDAFLDAHPDFETEAAKQDFRGWQFELDENESQVPPVTDPPETTQTPVTTKETTSDVTSAAR